MNKKTIKDNIEIVKRDFNKKTVVMQVLPHLNSGGLVSGAIEMAEAIKNAGGISLVVTSGGYRSHELRRTGSLIEILPVETKNLFKIKMNIKRIMNLINIYNVSLVHVRSRAPAWSCYWACLKLKIPMVTTFHGTYSHKNFIKKKYNRVMLSGTKTIAISEFISSHIKDIYNIDKNVEVIPRGVNTDLFSPAAVSVERLIGLSKNFSVDEVESVILMPGRLTRWKGHKYALEALSLMNKPNVRMLFVGDIQKKHLYKKELLNYAKKIGVENQISIVGHSRDMPAVMMLADVVLSCSEKPEAFGRIILEAQAMGRPIIAFNHGGAKELIKRNENGWLVDLFDVKKLAKSISFVLEMKSSERKKLANKSIKNVKSSYLKSHMCNKTLEVYNSVLSEFKYEKNTSN